MHGLSDIIAVAVAVAVAVSPATISALCFFCMFKDESGVPRNTRSPMEERAHVCGEMRDLVTIIIVVVFFLGKNSAHDLEICRLLLDHGADIHASDFQNATALMFAVQAGNHDLVSFLLDNGARIAAPTAEKVGGYHIIFFFF